MNTLQSDISQLLELRRQQVSGTAKATMRGQGEERIVEGQDERRPFNVVRAFHKNIEAQAAEGDSSPPEETSFGSLIEGSGDGRW